MASQFKVGIRVTGDPYNRRDIDRFFRQICFSIYRDVILGTPVDTGRAKNNWQLSMNTPSASYDPNAGETGATYGGMSGRAGANLNLADAKLKVNEKFLTTVHITNNVPYIEALERGHSKQNSFFADRAMRRAQALAGLMK
jgi:hypothetical protein